MASRRTQIGEAILRALVILVAGVVALVTLAICGIALLIVALTGSSYSSPITAAGWVDDITSATTVIVQTAAWLSVGVELSATVALIAAFRREAVAKGLASPAVFSSARWS